MTDEARLQRWLDSHRAVVATHPSADHIDVDTLSRHASGQLSAAKSRLVSEHLLACDDGRCGDFVRSQAADIDRAGDLLYDNRAESKAHGEQMRERTFQSREIVWSTFESLARELDAPIDDLVNEAMAAYAQVRGYVAGAAAVAAPHTSPMALHASSGMGRAPASDRDPLEETHDAPSISALDRSYSPPRAPDPDDDDLARTAARTSLSRPAAGRPAIDSLREPGEESRTTPRLRTASLPMPAALSRPVTGPAVQPPPRGRAPVAPPSIRPAGAAPPPLPTRLMPPSTQRMPDVRESSSPGIKRLVLTYQGRPYNVEKERFLIGRSKTQADLRLDDPNVSRQHAVIEHVGSAWYIVDLGSTNGVQVAGERVARRALSDGDVLVITSHEIRCSLR